MKKGIRFQIMGLLLLVLVSCNPTQPDLDLYFEDLLFKISSSPASHYNSKYERFKFESQTLFEGDEIFFSDGSSVVLDDGCVTIADSQMQVFKDDFKAVIMKLCEDKKINGSKLYIFREFDWQMGVRSRIQFYNFMDDKYSFVTYAFLSIK